MGVALTQQRHVLETDAGEELGHGVRRALDLGRVEAGSRNARNPRQLGELGDGLLETVVERVDDAPGSSHGRQR